MDEADEPDTADPSRGPAPAKPSALVFSPPPPPDGGVPGGIGAITAVLMRELAPRGDVRFVSPARKEEGGRFGVRRAIINISRLIRETSRLPRHGTVLFFSSAGFSFWEKCTWSVVVRLMGREVAMVMVDGNFPRYFEGLPPLLKRLARLVLRGGRFIIGAQSASWQEYYRATFPSARVGHVTAGVDREFYEPRPERASDGELTVLYVGWIIEAKGILDLLDAVALVLEEPVKRFRVRLVGPILGDGDQWRGEIARRGLDAHVLLAGSVNNRTELLREFRGADIFVFPSHFEGFPVALVEAAAAGLPCIGTRVGGIPDILDDGRAGLLVADRAPAELAAALRTMLDDRAVRDRFGATLRTHASKEYTHDASARSYLQLMGLS